MVSRRCFRKAHINLGSCQPHNNHDTYMLPTSPRPPATPPPPSPPPSPPRRPARPTLIEINERFRTGRPSSDLSEIGVIFKQFDGLETAGRPWESCVGDTCHCQGATLPGRVSAMIAYAGLASRTDRKAISLPFGDRSGVVLRNSELAFECMYGIDGATFNLIDPERPGCTASVCDAAKLCYHGTMTDKCHNGDMCGFVGAPPTAWHPRDVKLFLEMHKALGAPYKPPSFHSGYNEVIISSARLNRRLPDAVDAFFVLDHKYARTDALSIDVVQAHRDFLKHYAKTEEEVPLLMLNPSSWEAPFSLFSA